jgi:hypothetical protein
LVFGVDGDTGMEIANMLNCTNGKVSMQYMGFPISDRKLRMEVFDLGNGNT